MTGDEIWDEWVRLSLMWLEGHHGTDENGFATEHRYVDAKEDAKLDERCRRALATLLSTGKPPPEVCKALAAVIAPDGNTAAERKLVFLWRNRQRARPGAEARDYAYAMLHREGSIEMALEDAYEVTGNVDDAMKAVATAFDLSEARLRRIWKRFEAFREWRKNNPE